MYMQSHTCVDVHVHASHPANVSLVLHEKRLEIMLSGNVHSLDF
jgi:hypothetical protein